MTANQPGVWTRRRFLKMLGATSGGAAVMNAMSAWGMLPAAALAQTEPPQLEGRAEGTSVIVIGTGPGGSAAAYELINLGGPAPVMFTSEGMFTDFDGNPINATLLLGIPNQTNSAAAVTIIGTTATIRIWKWDGSRWVQ